jgi:hypothetical protein
MDALDEKSFILHFTWSLASCLWWCRFSGWRWTTNFGSTSKIHRNAHVISFLTSSVGKEEFNRVDGLDMAKDVWDTLQMTHEGWRPVWKAKIEMIEEKLNRFTVFDDESP